MNEYGFYIIIEDFSYFIFWRNIANSILIILVIILLYFLLRFIINKKNEEKTITYLNQSSIIYKWNNRGVITFSDLSIYIGKLKNNLPHGEGVFTNKNNAPVKLKFYEGGSSSVNIHKNENGYYYEILSRNNLILNKHFIATLKWMVIVNCFALLIALIPMPYGYYIILRILTTLTCCLIMYIAYSIKKIKTAIISGLIVVIYNPLIPIPLGRDIWVVMNLITLPILIILFFSTKRT